MKRPLPVVAPTDLVCQLMAAHQAGLARSITSLGSQPIPLLVANILHAITIFQEV